MMSHVPYNEEGAGMIGARDRQNQNENAAARGRPRVPTNTTDFCARLLLRTHGQALVNLFLDPNLPAADWMLAVIQRDKELAEEAHP